MKRIALVVALLSALFVAIWFGSGNRQRSPAPTPGSTNLPTSSVDVRVNAIEETGLGSMTREGSGTVRIGTTLLAGYADPALPPQNDLTLLSHLMHNYLLLVKTASDRPLSANEEWAAAFRGMNPARERFLPDDHVALNDQGQLIDRWTTPLFFHALGRQRFEIRSAGPDRAFWTKDDIHRNADGSFRHGETLSTSDLFQTATPTR